MAMSTGSHSKGPAKGSGLCSLRPEGMPGEEDRQIQDHADHRGRNRGQRRGELEFAARGLDHRPAGEDEQEARQEGEEGRHRGAGKAGRDGVGEHVLGHAADDSRPR